ncbi:hypothetical protein GGR50DRAFT_401518 [Xylaria sp. CBS 124048]|nr:hypothetical protein GGR50DRAFT_401518 [Xylaria sp. CBS 124048]
MTINQKPRTFTVPVVNPLSQGIELEFLIAYVKQNDLDPDGSNPSKLAPLLRVYESSKDAAEEEIREHVRQTLRNHGIRVQDPSARDHSVENSMETYNNPDLNVPLRISGFAEWDIGTDSTVVPDSEEARMMENKPSEYQWIGVELRSPASWASKNSYDQIRFVVDLIKSKYRVRVNHTCGFHIHVGNGRRYLDPRTLKRVAAFLYAADPMISRLHAPWRRVGHYSTSIRYESRLACWEGIIPSDVHLMVQRRLRDLRAKSRMNDPEILPDLPWFDTCMEEKDFGGPEEWRRYAKARVELGPWMTISSNWPPRSSLLNESEKNAESSAGPSPSPSPSPSLRSSGCEGSPYQRRLKEFMSTAEFHAQCRSEYQHDDPSSLTPEQQYRVLFLTQCELIFQHADLNRLSDSEFERVSAACAPYIQPTQSNSASDAASGNDSTHQQQHSTPPRSNELSASVPVDNINDEPDGIKKLSEVDVANRPSIGNGESAAPRTSSKADAHKNDVAIKSSGKPKPLSPANGSNRSPISGKTPSKGLWRSPSVVMGSILGASKKDKTCKNEDSPEPEPLFEVVDNSPIPDREQGEKYPKLQPHDFRTFPKWYTDQLRRDERVLRADWKRMSWLPSLYPDDPKDPAERHVRYNSSMCQGKACPNHPVTTTRQGVATILAVNSGAAVGALMVNSDTRRLPPRLNYNFQAYDPDTISVAEKFGYGYRFGAKRTIEFREAGGSLDAEWIVTWARICVGIVDFCRGAITEEYMRVLFRVMAEEDRRREVARHPEAYKDAGDEDEFDVCDLLEDLGLDIEADIVRRREARKGPPR